MALSGVQQGKVDRSGVCTGEDSTNRVALNRLQLRDARGHCESACGEQARLV